MKNLLRYILLLACTIPVSAQSDKNYVISKTYKQAGDNSFGKVSIQIQYLDGLGRPLQNQSVGQSTTGTDIIEPVEFDAYGRQVKNYLPYAGGGSGAFQDNAVSNQFTFYQNNVPLLDTINPGRPYQETIFESSPDARPLGARAPGDKSLASTVAYTANIANEVKKYNYTANADITQTISPTGFSYYAAGTLYRKETTDENQKTTVEFTDTKGRLICKITGNFSTYYVYDDFGLLRAVLQPRFQESDGTTAKFAFLYDYDERGRVITKKLPGIGKVDMVYDNFDRLVMSQDANQLQRGARFWSFIKYDALNRKVMTGERDLGSAFTRASLQTSFNSNTAHHEDRDGSVPGYTFSQTLPAVAEADILNVTYYDKYYFQGNQAFVGNTIAASGTNISAVNSLQTGGRTRMLNDGKQWMVATNHYDSELRTIQTIRQLYDFDQTAVERVSNKYKYDLAAVIDQQKTEQTFSNSQSVPDPNAAPIFRAKPENGGNLRTDNLIDQIVVTGPVTNSHLKTFTYDHADRLLSVKEQVITGLPSATKEATTVAQRYNVLGQLKEKWYHSANGTDFRRETIYTSNIRGWQTEGKTVFKKNYSDNTLLTNYFTSKLFYGGANFTNGNISKMIWSREGETFKGLSFTYDGVNRLTGSSPEGGYNDTENIQYDSNGNITSLNRAGASVDQLVYNRDGNQLLSITDDSGNDSGFRIGGAKSYSFDPNGNVVYDANKAATTDYSLINLPKTMTISGTPGAALVYDYDASGIKHKYTSSVTSGTTTTVSNVRYEGAFEYDKDKNFQRLPLTEGQAVLSNNVIRFNYYVKDHLGNVRMVFDEGAAVLQKNDYYPFGLEIDRNSVPATTDVLKAARNAANRYNFLGKETQIATGYIDLQARFYDPTTGRFMGVDPLAEKGRRWSSYNYSFDNPLRFRDPDGMWPWDGLVAAVKKWYNTPLTKSQQEVSRAASISNSPAKTQGEVYKNALISGITHASADWQPGNFRRPVDISNPGAKKPTSTAAKTSGNSESPEKPQGTYNFPSSQEPLPRQIGGEPMPDIEASGAHTQLGAKKGRKSTYNQAREFNAQGNAVRDIDFTDHGRPSVHPNPHQHEYTPNPTGGTPQRSNDADPLPNN